MDALVSAGGAPCARSVRTLSGRASSAAPSYRASSSSATWRTDLSVSRACECARDLGVISAWFWRQLGANLEQRDAEYLGRLQRARDVGEQAHCAQAHAAARVVHRSADGRVHQRRSEDARAAHVVAPAGAAAHARAGGQAAPRARGDARAPRARAAHVAPLASAAHTPTRRARSFASAHASSRALTAPATSATMETKASSLGALARTSCGTSAAYPSAPIST